MPAKLRLIVKSFLLIGSVSFGGYMALIAMVRRKFVEQDKAISDDVLMEGVSLASFLPGPIAVNVVAYVGYKLSGVKGAVLAVIAVLIPSFVLVCACSAFYFHYGTVYSFDGILMGVVPAVIGIIFSVGVAMAKKASLSVVNILISVFSFVFLIFFSGYWSVVFVLIIAGLVGVLMEYKNVSAAKTDDGTFSRSLLWAALSFVFIFVLIGYGFSNHIAAKLFTQFSAVSLTLFGGGYVMVPILKSILVDQFAWFNYQEFAFGISIGQVTPGPILISAAFFGYKMYGLAGAFISTVGIFLPSSLLMISASEVYQKVKGNRILQSALTGIKPAIIGLIFYSGVSLLKQHIEMHSIWFSLAIVVVSFFAILRFNIHNVLIVILSAVCGVLFTL